MPNKKSTAGYRILLFQLLVRGDLESPLDKEVQAVAIALGCPQEFDSQDPVAEDTTDTDQITWRKQTRADPEASSLMASFLSIGRLDTPGAVK